MTYFDRFNTAFATGGPTDPFSPTEYAAGWDTIGAGPPTVEQFNALQQETDQKDNWLFNQIRQVIIAASLAPDPDTQTTLRDAIFFILSRNSLVGEIKDFAGNSTPSGYVPCDGRALSRTVYATLFNVLGIVYGSGNGSTTFNVPDFRGRVAVGADDMGGTRANRLTNLSGASGLLGSFGGHQLLQQHDHAFSQRPHSHAITINASGFHGHSGESDIHGGHGHNAIIDYNGEHIHQDGREALYNHFGGGTQLNQGNFSYTATQFPKFIDANTSSSGNHTHTASISAGGAHNHVLYIGGNGSHTHDAFLTASNSDITFQASGGGNTQNVQPYLAINKIIFTGVFA